MTVDGLLLKLGLTDYADRFHAEQIDLDALVSDFSFSACFLPLGFCFTF